MSFSSFAKFEPLLLLEHSYSEVADGILVQLLDEATSLLTTVPELQRGASICRGPQLANDLMRMRGFGIGYRKDTPETE
jgi:hypothetical protein